MAVSNIKGEFLFINKAGRKLLGLNSEDPLDGVKLFDFFVDYDNSIFNQVILPYLVRHDIWDSETEITNIVTNEVFPIACFGYSFFDPSDPRDLEILWIIQDRRRRAFLNRQISQRVSEHRVVADLAQAALQVSWHDLLRQTVREVANVLEAHLVVIAQPIERSDKLHVVSKFDAVTLNLSVLEGGASSQAGYAILSGRPVVTPDVELESRVDTTVVRQLGLKSGMAVPIFQEDKPWGALSIHTLAKRQYTSDDVAFLEATASVLSSAQKRITAEREMQHQSLHDSLTGLPNRALMQDRLQHALETLKDDDEETVTVLLLDIDDFKSVNDSMGHEFGDILLRDFASRLQTIVGERDTLARLGGDEFVILCEDQYSVVASIELANQIRDLLKIPFQLDDRSIFVTASMGITNGRAYSLASELLREADTAMYEAKQRGIGEVQLYQQTMGEASQDRFQLATDLHSAIERSQLRLVYQPIVDLRDNEIVGAEALCRWDHPTRGAIQPDVFISLAEQTGQIRSLGKWVLEEACKEATYWHNRSRRIAVRVNVSAIQLQSAEFVEEVRSVLESTGIAAELVGLEITEGIGLDFDEVPYQVLTKLKELGIELLVDDYGTGYSSLNSLIRFAQVSVLKIDREFIQMTVDERHQSIIHSIVSLGHAIGMDVVAEGVETEAQLECAKNSGCDFGQGFLLGSPMEIGELHEILHID